jgi:hypothetical protein
MDQPMQFSGARLKVQRANRHVNEVNSLFSEFLTTDFCKLHIQIDPETGQNLLKLDSIATLPSEIALCVGDAIHNLRVAMDHIAFHLLGSDAEWISFPSGKKRDDLIATRQFRAIKEALPDLANFIADVIQPYDGGDHKFWEVGALDNLDKHRLIVPIASIQAITDIRAEDENRNTFDIKAAFVGEGGVLNMISTGAKMKITSYGKPTANIFFSEGSPAQGKPVIPTLVEYIQLSAKAIEALEAFHFGKMPEQNTVKS